jgi:calcineurin-like phosphoesterase family protein
MARERFALADTHYSQASMCAFPAPDGVSPLRPWGTPIPGWKQMSAEERADRLPELEARAAEMDEAMVERWNAVVPATGATVYHLGDVAMKAKDLPILDRLNGKKKLILGNHDILGFKVYAAYFYEIAAYKVMPDEGIVMSHMPVHEMELSGRWKTNVHGHTHAHRVMTQIEEPPYFHDIVSVPHPRYLCVSVEQTDYAPLPFDEMFKRIEEQQRGRC